MPDTCQHCGTQIHNEPAPGGAACWVDNTGGDVCAHDGGNSSHAPFESAAPAMLIKVWAATVTHKHGVNLYVGLTERSRDAQVAGYCRDNWDTERVPGAAPEADAEVIQQYFAHLQGCGEWLDNYDGIEVA